VLASATSGRANQVLVSNHLNARVGDEVTVAIEESALLSASLLVYALPLVLMILGAVIGQQWLPGQDAGAIAGAIVALGAGFGLARAIQVRSARGYEPTLVDILPGIAAA
jgi:sigma-E factor negative regulatory protein RseC